MNEFLKIYLTGWGILFRLLFFLVIFNLSTILVDLFIGVMPIPPSLGEHKGLFALIPMIIFYPFLAFFTERILREMERKLQKKIGSNQRRSPKVSLR